MDQTNDRGRKGGIAKTVANPKEVQARQLGCPRFSAMANGNLCVHLTNQIYKYIFPLFTPASALRPMAPLAEASTQR